MVCRFWPCAAQVVHYPRSRAFLPVLVSSERGDAAEPSPREEKSIETHIPYGGVQMRKTETVHKKTPRQGVGEGTEGNEDGLICGEKSVALAPVAPVAAVPCGSTHWLMA